MNCKFIANIITSFLTSKSLHSTAKESLRESLFVNSYMRQFNEYWDEYEQEPNFAPMIEPTLTSDNVKAGLNGLVDINSPNYPSYVTSYLSPEMIKTYIDGILDCYFDGLTYRAADLYQLSDYEVLCNLIKDFLATCNIYDERIFDEIANPPLPLVSGDEHFGEWVYNDGTNVAGNILWAEFLGDDYQSEVPKKIQIYFLKTYVNNDSKGNYVLIESRYKECTYVNAISGGYWLWSNDQFGQDSGTNDTLGFTFKIYNINEVEINRLGFSAIKDTDYDSEYFTPLLDYEAGDTISWSEMWLIMGDYIRYRSEIGASPMQLDMLDVTEASIDYATYNFFANALTQMIESVIEWTDIYFEQVDIGTIAEELGFDLGLNEDVDTQYTCVGGSSQYTFTDSDDGGVMISSSSDIYIDYEYETEEEILTQDTNYESEFIFNFINSYYLTNFKLFGHIKSSERGWNNQLLSIFDEQAKLDSIGHAKIYKIILGLLKLSRTNAWKTAIWGLENVAGYEREFVITMLISSSMRVLMDTIITNTPPSKEILTPEDYVRDLGMIDISTITSYLTNPEGINSFAYSSIDQNFMANIDTLSYFFNKILNPENIKLLKQFTIENPNDPYHEEHLAFWFDANPNDFNFDETDPITKLFRPQSRKNMPSSIITLGANGEMKKYAQLMSSRVIKDLNGNFIAKIIPTGMWFDIQSVETSTNQKYRFTLSHEISNAYGPNAIPNSLVANIESNILDPSLVWLFVRNGPFYNPMFVDGRTENIYQQHTLRTIDNIVGKNIISDLHRREGVEWVTLTIDGIYGQEVPIPLSKYLDFQLESNNHPEGEESIWSSLDLLKFLPYTDNNGLLLKDYDNKLTLLYYVLTSYYRKVDNLVIPLASVLLDYVTGFSAFEHEGEIAHIKEETILIKDKASNVIADAEYFVSRTPIGNNRNEHLLRKLIPSLELFLLTHKMMLINTLAQINFEGYTKTIDSSALISCIITTFRNLLQLIIGNDELNVVFSEIGNIAKILTSKKKQIGINDALELIQALDTNTIIGKEFREAIKIAVTGNNKISDVEFSRIRKNLEKQTFYDFKRQFISMTKGILDKTLTDSSEIGPTFSIFNDLTKDMAYSFFLLQGQTPLLGKNGLKNNKFTRVRIYNALADPFAANSMAMMSELLYTSGKNDLRDDRLIEELNSLQIDLPQSFSMEKFVKALIRLMKEGLTGSIQDISYDLDLDMFFGASANNELTSLFELEISTFFSLMMNSGFSVKSNPNEWARLVDTFKELLLTTQNYLAPFRMKYGPVNSYMCMNDLLKYQTDLFFLKGITPEDIIYTLFDFTKVSITDKYDEYLSEDEYNNPIYQDSTYSDLLINHLSNFFNLKHNTLTLLTAGTEKQIKFTWKIDEKTTISWIAKIDMVKTLEKMKNIINQIQKQTNKSPKEIMLEIYTGDYLNNYNLDEIFFPVFVDENNRWSEFDFFVSQFKYYYNIGIIEESSKTRQLNSIINSIKLYREGLIPTNYKQLLSIFTLDGFIRHEIASFKDGKWGYDFNKNLINQQDPKSKLTTFQKMNKVIFDPQTNKLRIFMPCESVIITNGQEVYTTDFYKKRFSYQLIDVDTENSASIEDLIDMLIIKLPNGQKVLDLGIISSTNILVPREDKSLLYKIITSLEEYKDLINSGEITEGDSDYEFYLEQISMIKTIAKSNFKDGELEILWNKANNDIIKFAKLLNEKLTNQFHEMSTYISLYNTDGTLNTEISNPIIKALKELKVNTGTGSTISVYIQLNRLLGKNDNEKLIPNNIWCFDSKTIHIGATQQKLKLMKLGLRHFNDAMRLFSSGLIHINDMPATVGNCMAYFTLGSQIFMGFSKELNGESLTGLVLHIDKILNIEDQNEQTKIEAIQKIFSDYDLMINILGLSGKKKLKQHEKTMFLLEIAKKYSKLTGMDIFGPGSIFGESISDPDNFAIKNAISILKMNIKNNEDFTSFEKAEKLEKLTGHIYKMLKFKNTPGMKIIADFVLTLQTSNKNMLISMLSSPITNSPKQAFMQLKTGISQDIGTAQILVNEANGYDIYLNLIDTKGGPISQLVLGEYGGLITFTLAFLAFVTDYIELEGKMEKIEIFEYINTFLCGLQFGIVLVTGISRFMINLDDPISLKKFIVDQCLPLDPDMDKEDYARREQRRHWLLKVPPDVLLSFAAKALGSLIMIGSVALFGKTMGFLMGMLQILVSQLTSLIASTLIVGGYALIGKNVVYSGETIPGYEGWSQYMADKGYGQIWDMFIQPHKVFWSYIKGFGAGVRSLFHRGRWYNPDIDSDMDGLTDKQELTIHMQDAPADYGFINLDWNDPDCDSDGIPDGVEVDGLYFNGTTWAYTEDSIDNAALFKKSNPLDWDSDNDMLDDLKENYYETNPNNPDMDGDGLLDGEEVYVFGTDPTDSDTDNDLLNDKMEVNGVSLTVDGITYGPYKTDPTRTDTDNDGLSDYMEIVGIDVSYFDTDHYWVVEYNYRLVVFTDPTKYDSDGDGLSDYEEIFIEVTNPNSPNTDGDLMSDFYEVHNRQGSFGTNPLIADSDEDPDGDLLPNFIEYNYGTIAWNIKLDYSMDYDCDGMIDSIDWNATLYDIDADGLIDGKEWFDNYNGTSINPEILDVDNDGLPNYLDSDSDNDGLSDGLEYILGSSQNVIDSDRDGIADFDEVYGRFGFNTNPANSDSDNDGISDYDEIFGFTFLYRNGTEITVCTHPSKFDSDKDGIPDGKEIMFPYYFNPIDPSDGLADFDGDLLSNAEEIMIYITNPYEWDTDNDLMPDGWELKYDLSPKHDANYKWSFDETTNSTIIIGLGISGHGTNGDYDQDGLTNYYEYTIGTKPNNCDSESDGLPDGWEVTWGTNPTINDVYCDYDSDGYYDNGFYHPFTNGQEYLTGCDPLNHDSDSDLLVDGFEYHYGLNPTSAIGNDGTYGDYDSDRVINLYEQEQGTNPNDQGLVDIDHDFIHDDWEIHYFGDIFLYGDTCDPDSDNLINSLEWVYYSNPNRKDTDFDSLTDYEEVIIYGTDPTGSDTDNDGLSDGLELDQYGTNAINDSDSDDDGLTDGDEHHIYGTHPGDPDSDNDLINDFEEVFTNIDGYITDPNNPDTDYDGMDDYWEIYYELNPTIDDANFDPDNDNLINVNEYIHSSDPFNNDTDSDYLPDGWEVQFGLSPIISSGINGPAGDFDNDLLINYDEYLRGTYPNNNDSDSDGITDYEEVNSGSDSYITNPLDSDTDNDLLNDYEETHLGTDNYYSNPLKIDSDNDNLTDYEEVTSGSDGWISDPLIIDTDGDSLSDYLESVIYNTDPKKSDTDMDGASDYLELIIYTTNPRDSNTDNDALLDGEEIHMGIDGLITDPKNTFDPFIYVQNLQVIQCVSPTELLVIWDTLAGVSQYEISYKHTDESDYHYVYTTSTSFILTDLLPGINYLVLIKAQSNYNNAWSGSNYKMCWTRQLPPLAPTTSLANYVDITITYTLGSSATDLELWMKIGSSDWTLFNTYSVNGSVTIQDCSENTWYYFKTRQRVEGTVLIDLYWSDYSTEISICTQSVPDPTPYSVIGFTGTSNQVNRITFTWSAPSNYMSGWYYKVERKAPGETTYTLIKTTSSLSFNYYPSYITISYTYRITCYNNDGVHGPYSSWTGAVSEGGGYNSESPDQQVFSFTDEPTDTTNTIKFSILLSIICLWILLNSIINYIIINRRLVNRRKTMRGTK
ncbi:MAG: hypothetical protein JXA54_05570 [Candidatus Heimdallarchaeota archaeon]|nr:hypothetical protein [Candidatus Heimdallarchaeota archaeon]